MLISSLNVRLGKNYLKEIENTIKENHSIENKFYTSYNDFSGKFNFINSFYSEIVKNIMNKLGLYYISRYDWIYWVQMYNSNTDSHDIHNHFGGHEIISWVHFVKTTGQRCFYFLGEDKTKFYPKEQKENDLIIFPSYRFHGVDPVTKKNKTRIVVAGNISLRSIDSLNNSDMLVCNETTPKTILWTSIPNK